MSGVTNALQIVLSIFIMIGIGAVMPLTGLFEEKTVSPILSKLVVKIALPAMIINNIFGKYTRETLLASLPSLAASFLNVGICFLLAALFCRVLKIRRDRSGVFTCLGTFCNSVFIGLPVTQALFGEEAVSITLLYYLANTSLFWTLGYALLCRDGDHDAKAKIKLKKVFSLPVLVLIASIVLVCLRVTLPKFLMSASSYVGNLVTPVSLMFIGMLLYRMIKNRTLRWEKEYSFILIARFIVCPALMLLLARFLAVGEINRNILFIEASMPCMSQVAIVAGECRSDEEFAAGAVALSTLLSLAVIPVYMALLSFVL